MRLLLLPLTVLALPALANDPVATKIDFVKDIQPIFETNCVGCHNPDKVDGGPDGDLDMTTLEKTIEGGEHGESLVPGKPEKSRLYKDLIRDVKDKRLMPPVNSGGPLKAAEIEKIRLWIEQGAEWPKEVVLKQRMKVEERPPSPDNLELIKKIHAKIVETSKEVAESDMKEYEDTSEKAKSSFKMVPIKGGEFLMGSPESEAARGSDEGPQVKVKVDPFWMGAHEVTWDLYMPFMITAEARYKDGSKKNPSPDDFVDAVSSPTTPYTDMTFGMGQDGYPAISMTEHAASKFCQWLSAQTGHFYRLPTEAEWEYAARAGTTTAYFFGDDPAQLGDYAWFAENSDPDGTGFGKSQPVGQKKPNPWGLYDIYGNVIEWTLDQYSPDGYKVFGDNLTNPFHKPTTLYPRVARGGGFKSAATKCRSSARRASTESWKQQDPQLPQSIWYHTDAQWLGFRLVRPLKIPSPEEMQMWWNLGTIDSPKP